ncbi:SH3 domain-containing protein [Chryseobacterium sp. SSA4.19]|uniref:SH3 domain-containing protein n=1 Tax=Chryseobacterium sp. SSA4.19 TaxID=2919915 RepID=UPI001F4DC9D4|nr:SH3 domain-containing protein [Chryseobacterium sp. SSA4.19]MCJ8155368.1 SH3 domain-containing protein [Chryseobacterium sp. SSA4.19]
MKPLFTFLLVCILQLFAAQQEEYVYTNGIFDFEENKTQKVFTDLARIRNSPDPHSRIADSLHTNQQVVILKKGNAILKLGERAAHWYKISYQKESETKEGYIWGGNLAIGYRNKNGYDFLFGLSKTIDRKDKEFNQVYPQNIAAVKVLAGNQLIDEMSFDTGSQESLSYATFTIESNHQLKNVECTLKASVSGEACGIAGYDQYILFRNKKLIALPQLMNVGDADVYYHNEKFIFPNDKGGMPNAFMLKMEEMEKDDQEREKKKKSSKTYLWDGNAYKLK